jgi:hypothetical protein
MDTALTYTAVLDVRENTLFFLARLLMLRRIELGTRKGRRALGCKQYNLIVRGVHSVAERANSLLKTTFKVLRRVSVCPWRIGAIAKAALRLLHLEHDRPCPPVTERDAELRGMAHWSGPRCRGRQRVPPSGLTPMTARTAGSAAASAPVGSPSLFSRNILKGMFWTGLLSYDNEDCSTRFPDLQ